MHAQALEERCNRPTPRQCTAGLIIAAPGSDASADGVLWPTSPLVLSGCVSSFFLLLFLQSVFFAFLPAWNGDKIFADPSPCAVIFLCEVSSSCLSAAAESPAFIYRGVLELGLALSAHGNWPKHTRTVRLGLMC